MKIYKFKDLTNESLHPHLFQIIDENKVWCAAPGTLNDEKEFYFKMNYRPTEETAILLARVLEKLGSSTLSPNKTAIYTILNDKLEEYAGPLVSEIVTECRNTIGVTSFSTSGTGIWLWEEYGGRGNGAVVEFEIPDHSIGNTFHLVDYVSDNVFHVDVFLKSQIDDPKEIFRKILCTKTGKWADEQEIRFLGKSPNINITLEASITGLTIGKHVSNPLAQKLISQCKNRKIEINQQE